jgi:hypothetical protein
MILDSEATIKWLKAKVLKCGSRFRVARFPFPVNPLNSRAGKSKRFLNAYLKILSKPQ